MTARYLISVGELKRYSSLRYYGKHVFVSCLSLRGFCVHGDGVWKQVLLNSSTRRGEESSGSVLHPCLVGICV